MQAPCQRTLAQSYGLDRGVAQLASAPALGAGGREFESRRPDQSHSEERGSWVSPYV